MSDEHRITDHRWESFTDDLLADVIDELNQGLGPASIAEPVAALQSIAESLYEIDTTLHDKLGELGVVWQTPQSSDLAKTAMRESRRYAGHSADGMTSTVGAMERQADTFARARDNLPDSQALRGSGNTMSMFELAGTGMGALTAHGQRDAGEMQRHRQEERARAIDALRGYNQDTNNSLGEHQPLPSPEPTSVDRSPVPSYTATTPVAAPTVGTSGAEPGFGAPQVTQTAPNNAAPAVGTGSTYPSPSYSYGPYRTGGGDTGAPAAGDASYQGGSPRSGGGSYGGAPPGQSGPAPGSQGGAPRGGVPTGGGTGGTGGGFTGNTDPRTGYVPQTPGGGRSLADGGSAGVGAPGQGRTAGLGGTAYAARYGGLARLASNEAAMGSAVAAGAAGAGMAGGTAEPDRLAKGRGAPGGSRDSFDEEFAEPEAPEGIVPGEQDPSMLPSESGGPAEEIPPERLPMTEPSTGGADTGRVRRFGTESEDLFEGPRVSKPVLGEFDTPESG